MYINVSYYMYNWLVFIQTFLKGSHTHSNKVTHDNRAQTSVVLTHFMLFSMHGNTFTFHDGTPVHDVTMNSACTFAQLIYFDSSCFSASILGVLMKSIVSLNNEHIMGIIQIMCKVRPLCCWVSTWPKSPSILN